MKKKINILLVVLVIILLFVLSLLFLDYLLQDRNIVQGYYKLETYGDREKFQHYAEYYKYYYHEDQDIHFHQLYYKIKSDNIERIKLYCNNFKGVMNAQDGLSEYDFDESIINESNYFKIIKPSEDNKEFYDYTVYIYDTSEHLLYYLHVT
jgi:hypothetical protein